MTNNNHREEVFKDIKGAISDFFEHIENCYAGTFDKFKVHTGYEEIDHLISGLHSGDLISIVGKSGTGKTTFLVNIAMNITMEARQEVALMRLQHLPDQLGFKFLGVESNVVIRD